MAKICKCLSYYNALGVACENGHIDCLKLAHKLGKPQNGHEMLLATRSGSLDCLIYCHKNGFLVHSDMVHHALFSGKIDCLEYILDKHLDGVKYDAYVNTTAYLGYLDFVKCLYKYGYKWVGRQNEKRFSLNRVQNIPCLKFIYYMYREKITNEEVSECIQPKIDEWKNLVNIVKMQMDGVPADIWNIIYTYW